MPKKSKRKSTEAAIELLDTSVQEEDAAPDEDVERQELPGEYSARRTCLTLSLTLLSRRFFSSPITVQPPQPAAAAVPPVQQQPILTAVDFFARVVS